MGSRESSTPESQFCGARNEIARTIFRLQSCFDYEEEEEENKQNKTRCLNFDSQVSWPSIGEGGVVSRCDRTTYFSRVTGDGAFVLTNHWCQARLESEVWKLPLHRGASALWLVATSPIGEPCSSVSSDLSVRQHQTSVTSVHPVNWDYSDRTTVEAACSTNFHNQDMHTETTRPC